MGPGARRPADAREVWERYRAPLRVRGPLGPCQKKLVPDAEKEEKDDQPERHAEQPEQDQDHLGSSLKSAWSARSRWYARTASEFGNW